MNKVFLSGTIAGTPVLQKHDGGKKKLTFALIVTHKTQAGEARHERYQINAWNSVAIWAHARLRDGMHVGLQGYLTQKILRDSGVCVTATEVTVEQFMPLEVLNPERKETEAPAAAKATLGE